MKNLISNSRFALILLIAAVVSFTSCEKEALDTFPTEAHIQAININGTSCVALLAGQHIDAGNICATISGTDLCITYSTTGDWTLNETHLWAGKNLADMPQNKKGNPKIGLFPYNSGDISGSTSYQVCMPLSDLGIVDDGTCNETVYVAAHAVVQSTDASGNTSTETAWGEGDNFVDQGSWATYFTLNLTCDANNGSVGSCETAFAYSANAATCFIGADFDGDGNDDGINRWGWSNGPFAPGVYTMDIYAGAGQCDLTKGTLTGTLTVDYDGSTARVTYTTNAPFTMDETHLYVGTDPLATDNGEYTVAPGQYGNINDLDDANYDAFTISNLSGDIYVVAHAVVCSAQ